MVEEIKAQWNTVRKSNLDLAKRSDQGGGPRKGDFGAAVQMVGSSPPNKGYAKGGSRLEKAH